MQTLFLNQDSEHDTLVKLFVFAKDKWFSFDEIHRIIMRLLIPHYDEARDLFDLAYDAEIVDRGLPDEYFFEDDLKTILEARDRLEARRDAF
jgi:hypothetical protein